MRTGEKLPLDHDLYWRWAVDDACYRAEARQDYIDAKNARLKKAGYMPVVRK